MREHQEGRIQQVNGGEGKVPHMAGMDGSMLPNLGSALFLCLLCTGRAMPGTLAHTHLALGPINLEVVLMELGEPEDHVLFP